MKRVITYGTFDLLHYGHINLLKRAKALGDYLIVAISTDEFNLNKKHKTCYFSYAQRKALVEAIRYVDEVVEINDDPSRIIEWNRRPFDCFFSGDDYRGNTYWDWEQGELRKLGADIEFFPYTQKQSTTKIRKKLEKDGE